MKNAALIGSALLTGALLTLTGCDDNYGDSCSFPQSEELEVACTDPGTGRLATCVYRRSSDCTSSICALYLGSDPFCTESCEEDSDCPGTGSVCRTLSSGATVGFCVIPEFAD